jgi:hypothetical protein
MRGIRQALSGNGRGSQKHLEKLRCVDQSTVSHWKAICELLDALDGKHDLNHLSHVQPTHVLEVARALRREHGKVTGWPGEVVDEAVEWIERCEERELTVPQLKAELTRRKGQGKKRRKGSGGADGGPAEEALAAGEGWRIDRADCLEWFAGLPADSLNLVFGSPPYEDARLYLEGGEDSGIARGTDAWVAWMVDVYQAALRCCTGLVAFVVEGRTENYRWSASPALLMAALVQAGVCLRKPPLYRRVGITGSGGPDWLRNDYEFIVCATRGGILPWSDNTAMGQPPKYAPGGEPSHRRQDGSRVNHDDGYATMADRNNVGAHRARSRAGRAYAPPEVANPGNVIDCRVGGGNMGDELCHENEAPFPEHLAEFFVRSFCPPGGVVADPFCGSGTTGKMAVRHNRKFIGCDIRESQVRLARRRISRVQPLLPQEANHET